jgi:hypothetical protein
MFLLPTDILIGLHKWVYHYLVWLLKWIYLYGLFLSKGVDTTDTISV